MVSYEGEEGKGAAGEGRHIYSSFPLSRPAEDPEFAFGRIAFRLGAREALDKMTIAVCGQTDDAEVAINALPSPTPV
jgi:hypothetical protein